MAKKKSFLDAVTLGDLGKANTRTLKNLQKLIPMELASRKKKRK